MDASLLQTAFKMTAALVAVLVTFGVAVFAARKFSASSKGFLKRAAKYRPLEIVAYQTLGAGKGVYLLRCVNQKILIGVTNANVNLLTEVRIDDDLEQSADFSSSLKKVESPSNNSTSADIRGSLKEISRV